MVCSTPDAVMYGPGHSRKRTWNPRHGHGHDGWVTRDPPIHARAELAKLSDDLKAGAYPNVHVLIVEYDGALVHEQYFKGDDETLGRSLGVVDFDDHTKHDLRSITKSITALLLGIALKDDFEIALTKPLLSYFPEWKDKTDPKMKSVTLEHALTMTSGIEWNEMDLPYSNPKNDEIRIYEHNDPFKHTLNRPMRETPGERWYYNGGLTTLLAGVIQKHTGQPFTRYARDKLFGPLGIKEYAWLGPRYWPPGMGSSASGLRFTARDLARFGSLVLHQGRWQGKQLVPLNGSGSRLGACAMTSAHGAVAAFMATAIIGGSDVSSLPKAPSKQRPVSVMAAKGCLLSLMTN